ncbi:hypothetical protein LSH36_1091g00240 [Paralvinella palmiformis]|uniref:Prephenate dehydratase n=1 Tax=Paralvinella palmiformis TaxID=53620 RepID=A0AAD9MRJ8_9ANNE|nr:hypothetical protein LSH36_1091g00240 [Paralvinella palmiformis]
MVIVLESSISLEKKKVLAQLIQKKYHCELKEVHVPDATFFCILGAPDCNLEEISQEEGVQRVIRTRKPYRLCSKEMCPDNTIVKITESVRFGAVGVAVIAGPCSVESKSQIRETAFLVKESGACMLRGGAYKPRTSPYSFQGLGVKGLAYLKEAGEATGLPIVSEIVSASYLDAMNEYVDMFQIGARNMQNFELLKEVASLGRPVLLKRGMAATIEEWLMAAEYLMAHGTKDIVLCERGIRTFETYTRNTLDITAIPAIKTLTHLPILVDPSHATGLRDQVPAVSLAAVAAGADGLIIEVHPHPENALSDGAQSLYPQQFEKLMRDIEILAPLVSREILRVPHKKETSLLPRKNQNTAAVAFQGQHGSYSEQALQMFFQNSPQQLACKSFHEVFKSIDKGEAEFGVIPIENSLMGTIHDSYDMFVRFPDISITAELYLRIEHSLIGLPESDINDITTVYSQNPGFEQCRDFLAQYPVWRLVLHYDTAGAVAKILTLKDLHVAAIAHERVASMHNLKVLAQGIETNPHNYTRFVVLSRKSESLFPHPNKASMVFQTEDKPGALFQCLKIAAKCSLNLKKIESRPIQGKPWRYRFYLDVEMPERKETFDEMLKLLKEESSDFLLIGIYKADLVPS